MDRLKLRQPVLSHALLKKLAELRDSEVLTEEEFATQKARLLNS